MKMIHVINELLSIHLLLICLNQIDGRGMEVNWNGF